MLYVFLVNTGTMMHFDMELALETVENLRSAIHKQTHIDPSNQVLLISGGESLYARDRVCKYTSAGTDTSPIFLFSKAVCDLPNLPESTSEEDLTARIEECFQLESNANTVNARTEMAHFLFDYDKSIMHGCEKLLHDQHLQHQGWASVVCNLEDITESFTRKAGMVVRLYQEVLKNQANYHRLLDNFESDKENLKKIPLLKSLNLQEDFSEYDEVSLFDWIQRKDNKTVIDDLYCRDELIAFDQANLDMLQTDINAISVQCNNLEMKEIKGLDVRLAALDKHMSEVRKLFERQSVMNQTFNQNKHRLSGLNDPSVLPELCRNHREYLMVMWKYHRDMMDLRKRFHLSKRELSDNLTKRLDWIIHIEERLKKADEGLMKVGFRLTKIRDKLEIIQNLHLSPEIYLSSVAEVFRRKQFSSKFYRWAQETSDYARKIVESEICQRRLFASVIDKHFTKWFFSGMNDLPQNFAEPPVEVDKFLPQITQNDLDFLIERLPDMKRHLKVASIFEVPMFDIDRSSVQSTVSQINQKAPHFDQETNTSIVGQDLDELKAQQNETDNVLRLKEKEIQSFMREIEQMKDEIEANQNFIKKFNESRSQMTSDLESVKKELNNDLKKEQENLKDYFETSLNKVRELLEETSIQSEKHTGELLSEIEAKNKQNLENASIQNEELSEKLKELSECENSLKITKEELDVANSKIAESNNFILSQECELERLRSAAEEMKQFHLQKSTKLAEICEQIKRCKEENNSIKNHFTDQVSANLTKVSEEISKECQHISEALEKYQIEQQKNVAAKLLEEKNEEIERLKFDHKNEIESLKLRFKLAINTTSIPRTESETSLEKVQLDVVDHSALEKEMSKLSQALQEKKNEYEQNLMRMKNQYDLRVKAIKAEYEHDRMNSSIMVENQDNIAQKMKLKTYETMLTNLLSIFNVEQEPNPEEFQQKFSKFKELVLSCSQKLETIAGSQSFVSIPSTPETAKPALEWFTSQFKEMLNGEPFNDIINLNSCEIGDCVFVYFNTFYQQFTVYQKESYLHFVHAESSREFDLTRSGNDCNFFVCKVVEKEFCMTKKAENRYKLPLDTKFFRVRVKQGTRFIPNNLFESIDNVYGMTQSIATSMALTSNTSGARVRTGSTNSDSSPMSGSVNIESTSKKTI